MAEAEAVVLRQRVSIIPWVILGVALAATAVATLYVHRIVRVKDHERFDNSVQQVHDNIRDRMNTYVAMLRGTRGLFAVGRRVAAPEFGAYVQRLELERHWPGVQGIGYCRYVTKGNRYANLMEESLARKLTTRVHGVEEPFRIWPEGDRDEYHPIIYLEPLNARNHAAIGYDMFTEPVRREAMERARDTGEPAASGRVRLIQDKVLDGAEGVEESFLLYVPVYLDGVTPNTPEGRRERLRGFVYSPFRTGELLAGIFGSEANPRLSFTIYDGNTPAPDRVMFDGEADAPTGYRPRFTADVPVEVAGRTWTLRCATRPGFELASGQPLVPLVPVAGGVVSVGLFLLARAQSQARARAEDAVAGLRQSERALRESEGRLRRLVDSNVIGVAYADTRGGVGDANQAFADLVGYGLEEIRAGKVRWDQITPPEYAEADRQAVAQLLATGMCKPFEKEFVRKDGSRVPVLIGIAAVEGSSTQAIGLAVDLTERKRGERERAELLAREQEARKEAERANQLKDEFLATISHELRTPLNAIMGWTHLLRARDRDAAAIAEGLDVIDRNARMQAQLIDDLLDVSRIVSGKLRVNARRTDLVEVVDAAVQSVRPAVDAKQVRLATEYGGAPGVVWADPDRMQQVVWNLLSNAIKFTPRGGLVEVSLAPGDGHVELVVRDTGQGIKPEFLPHVFSAFRQADATTTRKHGGLGLGLAIVRHLVELHGGTVEANSEGQGKGATFKVVLPTHGDRQAAATQGEQRQVAGTAGVWGGGA